MKIIMQGNWLPASDTFAVLVRKVGGAVEQTIGISFTDGTTLKTINWPSPGEFDRLVFSIYE